MSFMTKLTALTDSTLHDEAKTPPQTHARTHTRNGNNKKNKKSDRKDCLNEWLIQDYVGEGAYGQVFQVTSKKPFLRDKSFVAKIEKTDGLSPPQLEFSQRVLHRVNRTRALGFPHLIDTGTTDWCRYIVMPKLGKSMEEYLSEAEHNKLCLKDCLMIMDQAVTRIETLHTIGFLHRDIKPGNMTMGPPDDPHRLFFIDFGMSAPWWVEKEFVQRVHDKRGRVKRFPALPLDEKNPMSSQKVYHYPNVRSGWNKGTPLFQSIAAHESNAVSRKDDMESLMYVLMHFMYGETPWAERAINDAENGVETCRAMKRELMTGDDKECHAFIRDWHKKCKRSHSVFFDDARAYNLVEHMWVAWVRHIRTLRFTDKPNYALLRTCIHKVRKKLGIAFDNQFTSMKIQ